MLPVTTHKPFPQEEEEEIGAAHRCLKPETTQVGIKPVMLGQKFQTFLAELSVAPTNDTYYVLISHYELFFILFLLFRHWALKRGPI